MRVGVIGIGVIGKRHINNLINIEGVKITAVCGRDEEKTKAIAREFEAQPFTDYQELFDQTELDAVFICTPPGVRTGPIAEAAARGIPCFIEKPPAKTMQEAEEIEMLLRNSGIIHSVGFMYRYAGAVCKARELVEASGGPVPIVRSIHVCGAGLLHATTPRWLYNKSLSGGPIFDQAIHLLDASRYVSGSSGGTVSGIHAFGSNVQRPKSDFFTVEENFIVNLAYSSGTIHTHTHSWGIAESQVKIELLSDDYRLLVDLTTLGSRLHGTYKGQEISFHDADENMYAEEVSVFVDAVRTGDPSAIRSSYADAAVSLGLVIKASESADSQIVI
ncbi:Gfo/Idh/MocA family protein [Paenibacillus sp. strain BS8-2]